MGETYTPFTWVDGAGITEITSARLNSIETGVESMDDRVTAAEDALLTFVVAAPTGVAATDTAAIQAALTAANTAGGGLVQLREGVYKIAAPGTPSSGGVRVYSNTVLAGRGIGVTTLQVVAGTTAGITGIVRTPTGVANTSVLIRDFTVDGNKANVSGSPTIIGFYAGVTPQSTSTDLDIAVERVEIMNCTDYGFDPHERVTRLRFTDCLSHDNDQDGFTLDGQYDFLVEGCIAWNNGRHGFNFVTGSARGRVVGCHAYGNTSNGYTTQNGAKNIMFSACRAYNNTAAGYVLNGVAQTSPELDLVAGGNHTLSGCTAGVSGTHGFQLVGISGCTLTGCRAYDNSQTTNNSSSHFRVAESGAVYSTNNSLIGCTWSQSSGVSNAAKYGVDEQSSNDGPSYVLGCSGSGTATGDLHLLHATSLLTAAHNGTAGGHPATFAYAFDTPAKHGLLEWNFDPTSISTVSSVCVSGTLYLMKITPQASGTISNLIVNLGTVGSTLTSGQNLAAIFNSSGTQLGITGDQTTAWGSGTGVKTMALTAGAPVTAGADYWVAVLSVGTTPASFSRAGGSGGPVNVGLSTSTLRFATNGTSLTAMPGSITPSSNSSSTNTFWCALS